MSIYRGTERAQHLTANDLDFLAGEMMIDIIPVMDKPQYELMNGDFVGEFVRGVSTTVPLWVALYLKKLDKCKITIPDTHTVPSLSLILANESASDSALSALPPFFFELARALLAHARADLPDPAAFESLLKDTEDLRAAKIRDRVKRIGEKQLQIFSVQNLTPYELRGQAGVVRATLDAFLAIDRSGPGAEDAEGGR